MNQPTAHPSAMAERDGPTKRAKLNLMQYTKPMIDLVLQIRKKVLAPLESTNKVCAQTLLNRLGRQHSHRDDASLLTDVGRLIALCARILGELAGRE